MRLVAVYIRTSRQTQGRAYCERYPEKADDLWIVASARGRKERIHIGPPTLENRVRAEQKKKEIETALHLVRSGTTSVVKPTLASAASDYLRRGMALHQLAASTQEDRCMILAEKGALLRRFGSLRLNSLTVEMLLDWWQDFVIDGKKSVRTGRNHLDALSGIYRYAMQRRIVNANPVDALRSTLRALNRTKAARQEQDAISKANPIESVADLSRFVRVSANWNQTAPRKRRLTAHEETLRHDAHIANLLLLDAGLRLGEGFALRWRHIWWGRDANDINRHLVVEEALARGRHEGPPKSGRSRKVALSRRLRTALQERNLELGRPNPNDRILLRRDTKKYRDTQFRRICEAAGIGRRDPKDLRDCYASHLLSVGVNLAYIAEQLGHANVAITARHYGRWVTRDGYQEPLNVAAGEVPADLLARLDSGPRPELGLIRPEAPPVI